MLIGFLIGQVEKFYLPESDLKQRYSQIVGFHNVSSYIGQVSRFYLHQMAKVMFSSLFVCLLPTSDGWIFRMDYTWHKRKSETFWARVQPLVIVFEYHLDVEFSIFTRFGDETFYC